MIEEAKHAAQWWMDTLRALPKTTDSDESPLLKLDAEVLEAFRSAVFDLICERFQGHWHPDQKLRASAYRSISYDNRLDPLLVQAAKLAAIKEMTRRLKDVRHHIMYVNPGEVKIKNTCLWTSTAETIWSRQDGSSRNQNRNQNASNSNGESGPLSYQPSFNNGQGQMGMGSSTLRAQAAPFRGNSFEPSARLRPSNLPAPPVQNHRRQQEPPLSLLGYDNQQMMYSQQTHYGSDFTNNGAPSFQNPYSSYSQQQPRNRTPSPPLSGMPSNQQQMRAPQLNPFNHGGYSMDQPGRGRVNGVGFGGPPKMGNHMQQQQQQQGHGMGDHSMFVGRRPYSSRLVHSLS